MGGRGLAVARGRPRRGGAEVVEREHRKGAPGGGPPPGARQIRRHREEGGGGRGGAAGRLLDLPPEWSIAWPADGGSEGDSDEVGSGEGEREKGMGAGERVRWGKGWGVMSGSRVWVVWMKERNKG
jgi:hypothetical protein